LLCEGIGDHEQEIGAVNISQFGVAKFVGSPVSDQSWWWTLMDTDHLGVP
jgi:hypothetical protein